MQIDDYRNTIRKFAIYPHANTGTLPELMYLALGLSDEAGEVAGKIKKVFRDGTRTDYQAIAKELGDVAWYWARLCEAVQFRCEDVLQMNVEKLADRKERGVIGGSGDDR